MIYQMWQETIEVTKWKPKSQLTHNLSRGSLACQQDTSSLWWPVHLVVRELIGTTPSQGRCKNLQKMRALNVTSAFGALPENKPKNPSQIHEEMATNNHQLVPTSSSCSKPSRCQQTPRIIRKPQLERSPSATKCNHSSKCTNDHSQSHYDDESMEEMSGRCLLYLTRM
jgi:hypothetical protein